MGQDWSRGFHKVTHNPVCAWGGVWGLDAPSGLSSPPRGLEGSRETSLRGMTLAWDNVVSV